MSAATGFPQVLATASGTAALHLGYRCLGVSPGDVVEQRASVRDAFARLGFLPSQEAPGELAAE